MRYLTHWKQSLLYQNCNDSVAKSVVDPLIVRIASCGVAPSLSSRLYFQSLKIMNWLMAISDFGGWSLVYYKEDRQLNDYTGCPYHRAHCFRLCHDLCIKSFMRGVFVFRLLLSLSCSLNWTIGLYHMFLWLKIERLRGWRKVCSMTMRVRE